MIIKSGSESPATQPEIFSIFPLAILHLSLSKLHSRMEFRLQANGIKFGLYAWISLTIAHRALHIDLQGE